MNRTAMITTRPGWALLALVISLVSLPALLAALTTIAAPEGDPGATPPDRVTIELGDSPALGPEGAPVTIVEFGDFECPWCARGSRALQRVRATYPSQVRYVFKHFPLRSHPNAALAHEAALAAADQGKFWEMYAMLYAFQGRLSRAELVEYAEVIHLDLARFTDALGNRRYRSRVYKDLDQGRRLKVTATPTYFINGKRVIGSRDFEAFKELVDEELRAARPSGQGPGRSLHPSVALARGT